MLPFGSRIQVTKEEDHLDVLAPYVGSGQGRVLAVTLRATTQTRARSVELGGRTHRPAHSRRHKSQNLLPIVRHLRERGLTTVARARVKGASLKADVVLDACKADDDIDEWFSSVRVSAHGAHCSARSDALVRLVEEAGRDQQQPE